MSPAGSRATTAHGRRTYESLLEAGRALAIAEGVDALSISRIADAAGVAKGTFYVHFDDRDDFVEALRAGFQERMGEVISDATGGLPAGRERLVAGLTAYLDACLADPAMKALAREMSSTGGDGPRGEERFARLIERNLRAAGWADARAAAILLAAATARVATMELESGRRQPAARRALWHLIG